MRILLIGLNLLCILALTNFGYDWVAGNPWQMSAQHTYWQGSGILGMVVVLWLQSVD